MLASHVWCESSTIVVRSIKLLQLATRATITYATYPQRCLSSVARVWLGM